MSRDNLKKLLKALSWIAGFGIAACVSFTWYPA